MVIIMFVFYIDISNIGLKYNVAREKTMLSILNMDGNSLSQNRIIEADLW